MSLSPGWSEICFRETNEAVLGLVRQAVAWHRLEGGERMILAVTAEDEAAGAGRFYQRLGWQVLMRQRKGWQWSADAATQISGTV